MAKYSYLVTLMVETDEPVRFVPFQDTLVLGRVVNVNESGKPNEPFGLQPLGGATEIEDV